MKVKTFRLILLSSWQNLNSYDKLSATMYVPTSYSCFHCTLANGVLQNYNNFLLILVRR